MTQSKSGIRRAWVGFSALAFAICGVLLLVRFTGRLGALEATVTSPTSLPGPAPAIVVSPPAGVALPPPVANSSLDHTKLGGPSTDQPPPLSEPAKHGIDHTKLGGPSGDQPPPLSEPAKHGIDHTKLGGPSTDQSPPLSEPAKHDSDPASRRLGGKRDHSGGASKSGLGAGIGALGPGSAQGPVKTSHRAPGADRSEGGAAPEARDKKLVAIAAPEQAVGEAAPSGADGAGAAAPSRPAGLVASDKPAAAAVSGPGGDPPLTAGVLKVNVPPTMIVGQSEHVRAVVGAKLHVDLVDKEAALETNDGARVQIGRDLMISTLVRMELRGDSASEFDITSLSPDSVQRINDNDATVWEWSVTPKLEGAHSLTLLVSDLKEATRETIRNKIYPVRIDVHVTAWQRVRDVVATGSTLLSGLAGLIGAWLGLLRPLLQRRLPEGGPGAVRAPQGTPPPAAFNAAHAPAPVVASTAPPPTSPPPAVAAAPPAAVPPTAAAAAAATSTDALAMDVAVAAAPLIAAVAPSGPVIAAASAADLTPAVPQPSAPSSNGKAS